MKGKHLVVAAALACALGSCAETEGVKARDGQVRDTGRDRALSPDGPACPSPRWESMFSQQAYTLTDLWGFGELDLFALDTKAHVLRYTGGVWFQETVNWTRPEQLCCLGSLWGSSAADMYATGNWYVPPIMVDAGPVPDASLPHLASRSRGVLLRRGSSGWDEVQTPYSEHLGPIWGHDAKNIFIVSRGSPASTQQVTMLHYDGTTFTSRPLAVGVKINDMWGSGPDNVLAVGDGGVVYRFDGKQWKAVKFLGTNDLRAIWGSGPDNIWAVGDGIFHFNGKSWTTSLASSTYPFADVWGLDRQTVFTVGGRGAIQRFDGKMWGPDSINHTHRYGAIWGMSPGIAYIGGHGLTLKLTCKPSPLP